MNFNRHDHEQEARDTLRPVLASAAGPDEATRRRTLPILLVIISVSALIRLPGLFSDFWIDEVWSHSIASQLKCLPDVLLSEAGRIDNNHPLITLWMWLLGPTAPVWAYRIPSLLAGVGSCLLVWQIARTGAPAPLSDSHQVWREEKEALLAAAIITFAFPFAFYASEARGYSLAVFFALLSYLMLRNAIGGNRRCFAVFNLATICGMLSHLTFLPFLAAMMFASIISIRRSRRSIVRQSLTWLALFAIPSSAAFALHHVFIRHLIIGGAAPTNPWWTIVQSISLTVGGATHGWLAALFAVIVAALFILGLRQSFRTSQGDRALLELLAVVVMPGALFFYDVQISSPPQPLMPRYFLIPMAFAIFAVSRGLLTIFSGKISEVFRGVRRVALIVFAGGFLFSNAVHWRDFALHGRGETVLALRHMIASTQHVGPVVVATQNSFRVGWVVQFDRSEYPDLQRIELQSTTATIDADFWITTKPDDKMPATVVLDSSYPAGELSGTSWWIYRSMRE